MRLFFNIENRRTEERRRMEPIDSSVLMRVMAFADEIEPLRRPSSVSVELVAPEEGEGLGRIASNGSYCLLVFSGTEAYGAMNAGYAAGQMASYLRFLGIPAHVQPAAEAWMHQQSEGARRCRAVVSFGGAAFGETHHRPEQMEHPCISHEYREDWAAEVLDFTKRSFPVRQANVRALNRSNCICFVPKSLSGRKTAVSELEAGIAAARVMAAAEELWIDLVPVDTGDPRCLISLCRPKDRAEIVKESRRRAEEQKIPRGALRREAGKPAIKTVGWLNRSVGNV